MLAREELLQGHRGEVGRDREAVYGDLAPVLPRPGVERGLEVDVFERCQGPGHHRVLSRAVAEEVGEERHDLVALLARLAVDPLEERLEGGGELPGLELSRAGHGTDDTPRIRG